MKTIGLILCNVAIALGIWAGRGEYIRERDEARQREAERQAEIAASQEIRPASVARRGPSRRSGPAPAAVTDDMVVRAGPADDASSAESVLPRSGAGESTITSRQDNVAPPFAPSARLKARFDAAADALSKLDFQAAETQALAIADDPQEGKQPGCREAALQLAAKARAFRRVLGRALSGSPAPSAAAPRTRATVAQVLLSNGSRFEAQLVEERPERYIFKLGSGGTFSPRREDVVELQRVEKEVSVGPDWNELQPKIAALEHPVDIFVDGVERCIRLGLKKEGLQLLENLLARPDSDEVPLLFAADADASLLDDWQTAGGRKSSGAPTREPRLVAKAEASSPGAAPPAAEQEMLLEAQRLVEQARGIYQTAIGKEGRGDDLRQARDKLHAARQLLEQLPEDEDAVKTLRRAVAQLLSDVARVSPF